MSQSRKTSEKTEQTASSAEVNIIFHVGSHEEYATILSKSLEEEYVPKNHKASSSNNSPIDAASSLTNSQKMDDTSTLGDASKLSDDDSDDDGFEFMDESDTLIKHAADNMPSENKPITFFETARKSLNAKSLHPIFIVKRSSKRSTATKPITIPQHKDRLASIAASPHSKDSPLSSSGLGIFGTNSGSKLSSQQSSSSTNGSGLNVIQSITASGVASVSQLFFYKDYADPRYNDIHSPMIPLEAICYNYYKLLIPDCVSKTYAHYVDCGAEGQKYVGVSSKAIPNFRSIASDPLTDTDLKNHDILKHLALILTASYIFAEDDLHRGNLSKHHRIDFDMSLWPILYYFKKEWTFRPPEKRFDVIDPDDILHFPNLKKAKPFYWPTNDPSIIPPGIISAIEKVTGHKASENAFTIDVIELFRKLELNETFRYYKYRTLLKYILTDQLIYRNLARLVSPQILKKTDGTPTDIYTLMADYHNGRIAAFKGVLQDLPEFQEFIQTHGEQALKEIKAEFAQHDQHHMKQAEKLSNKTHKQHHLSAIIRVKEASPNAILWDDIDIIDLRYDAIMAATKASAADMAVKNKINEAVEKCALAKTKTAAAKTDAEKMEVIRLEKEAEEAKKVRDSAIKTLSALQEAAEKANIQLYVANAHLDKTVIFPYSNHDKSGQGHSLIKKR